MEAVEAAERFAPRALEIFPGAEVYLYGSHAKGYATKASDIDVALVLSEYDEDETPATIWEKTGKLWWEADEVDSRIEPVVRTRKDTTGFVRSIMDTGIRIA